MKNSIKKIIAAAVLVATPGFVLADADISVQPFGGTTEATANVDICIVVPEILIFGVGETGDTISKIRWEIATASGATTGNNQTYAGAAGAFTAPDPFSTAVTSTVPVGGGAAGTVSGGPTVTLPVFLFSNGGDVTITATVGGGNIGGGAADVLESAAGNTPIPIAEIVSGQAGNIIHPALATGTAATTVATDGVVNLDDEWTYTYTPVTIPAAGTYEARITYVATQP